MRSRFVCAVGVDLAETAEWTDNGEIGRVILSGVELGEVVDEVVDPLPYSFGNWLDSRVELNWEKLSSVSIFCFVDCIAFIKRFRRSRLNCRVSDNSSSSSSEYSSNSS